MKCHERTPIPIWPASMWPLKHWRTETDARTEVTLMLGGIRIYYSISPSPQTEKNVPQLTAALFRSIPDGYLDSVWFGFGIGFGYRFLAKPISTYPLVFRAGIKGPGFYCIEHLSFCC